MTDAIDTATPKGVTLRRIARVERAGNPSPGFAGPGHTAVEVFGPRRIASADPFVMLLDDRLDFRPGQTVGDAHPHAGLETVTLMLEGSLYDPAFGTLETGDVEWMTAGRGIVHSEGLKATGWARILQLWIALPSAARFVDPDLQVIPLGTVPVRSEPGVKARLYSGRTGNLVSPTRNLVPTTLVDFQFDANASMSQALAGSDTGFVYIVSGSVRIGDDLLHTGDVGWFDRSAIADTELAMRAEGNGARLILYAGAPLGEPIVQNGPFVAGSAEEISAFYRDYRGGNFKHLLGMASR